MRSDAVYLSHMRDAVQFILRESQGMTLDEFLTDLKTQFAMIRAFEILGEAVKNISDELKVQYPDIQWKVIAGTRDVLIHRYFSVDPFQVWTMIEKDVPELAVQMQKIPLLEQDVKP